MRKSITFILVTTFGLGCFIGNAIAGEETKLPFQYLHNQIVVEIYSGQHGPYYFLVDTGVDPSALDLKTAEELGLTLDADSGGMVDGVGNDDVVAYPATLEDLSAQGANYGDVEALVMDLGRLSERLELPLSGILGYSFLNNRSITIDYQNQELTLSSSPDPARNCEETSDLTDQCYWIPMEADNADNMIPVLNTFQVNGTPFRVSLDTGSSLSITMNPEHLESLSVPFEMDPDETVTVVGARGAQQRKNGTISNISFGPFHFDKLEALFDWDRYDASSTRQGNIGNKVFENFEMTFDYVNGFVKFQKAK